MMSCNLPKKQGFDITKKQPASHFFLCNEILSRTTIYASVILPACIYRIDTNCTKQGRSIALGEAFSRPGYTLGAVFKVLNGVLDFLVVLGRRG